jgi:hypothetical protein
LFYRALEHFNTWTSSAGSTELAVFGLLAIALGPLEVLVHELGHAAVALASGARNVRIRVGPDQGLVRGRLGRVEFSLDPRPSFPRGSVLVAEAVARDMPYAFFLAGPAAQLALALVFLGVAELSTGPTGPLFDVIAALIAFDAAWNLVPHSRRGIKSDGGRLVDGRRMRKIERADPTVVPDFNRWRAARFESLQDCPETTKRLLSTPAVVLGYANSGDDRAGLQLRSLAIAGWTWGHAIGDTGTMTLARARETTDAIRLAGHAENQVLARSAVEMVRRLPADATNRRLERAFMLVENSLADRRGTKSTERQFAFCFGLALQRAELAVTTA